jgi:uncharacterized protein (DUF1330 family)
MAAFVLVEMAITDPVAIEDYRRLAGASVTAHGGRFLARGGRTEVLDGDWRPERIVIIEFPSAERARQWRASPEYRAACETRNRAARTRMLLVEGVA